MPVNFIFVHFYFSFMKLDFSQKRVEKIKCDVLIVGMFEKSVGDISDLDGLLNGEITRAVKNGAFLGEFRQVLSLSSAGRISADRIVLVGLGKKGGFDTERLRRVSGVAIKTAKNLKAKTVATTLHKNGNGFDVAEAMLLALYDFNKYRSKKTSGVETIFFIGSGDKKVLKKAGEVAGAVNFVRDIVNTPSNDKSPKKLAKTAKLIGKGKMRVSIYGEHELKKMKFSCFLAVARGSSQGPRLVVMDYNPKGKKTIALVGKGIVFDSGGLDIKPWPYMLNMKTDMAGAAAILGVMKLLPSLGVKHRVIGIMPFCENMPSGDSMRTGDIIKSYSKKTVEIINTDAEGRLILSDALAYAEKKYKPDAIIDLATLTGACIVALGHESSGLWGDSEIVSRIKSASEATSERVWEMPLYEEYSESMKSDIADIRNISKIPKGGAGASAAAAFLKTFVEKTKWAHIDIAGPAFIDTETDYIPAAATGWGVRLLAKALSEW